MSKDEWVTTKWDAGKARQYKTLKNKRNIPLSVRIVEAMLCACAVLVLHILFSTTVFQYAYVVKKDLSGMDWHKANLNYHDLRGLSLRKVDFGLANLRGTRLTNVDLSGAFLRGADLRRADMQGALLNNANLKIADLERADLRYSDLSQAVLDGALLFAADLRAAKLTGTSLKECKYDAATKWPIGYSPQKQGAIYCGVHIITPEPTPHYWRFPETWHQ